MTGASPQPEQESQAQIFRRLLPAIEFLHEARRDFMAKIEQNIFGEGKPHEDMLVSYAKAVASLETQDYLKLRRLFAVARDPNLVPSVQSRLEALHDTSEGTLKGVANLLLRLYANAPGAGPQDFSSASISPAQSGEELHKFDRAFARDASLVLRAIYPFGVNLLNPGWQSGAPIALGSGDSLRLSHEKKFLDTETLEIKMGGEGMNAIVRLPDQSALAVRPGQSVLLGYPLVVNSLFGTRIEDFVLQTHGELPGQYSGASILLVRDGDRMYIFDRANLNDLYIQAEFKDRSKFQGTVRPDQGMLDTLFGPQS